MPRNEDDRGRSSYERGDGTVAVTKLMNYDEEEEWRCHVLDLKGKCALKALRAKGKAISKSDDPFHPAEKMKYFGVFMHF